MWKSQRNSLIIGGTPRGLFLFFPGKGALRALEKKTVHPPLIGFFTIKPWFSQSFSNHFVTNNQPIIDGLIYLLIYL